MQRRLDEGNSFAWAIQCEKTLRELIVDPRVSECRRMHSAAELANRCLRLTAARVEQAAHEVVEQRIAREKTSLARVLDRIDEAAGASRIAGRHCGRRGQRRQPGRIARA